MQDEELGHFRKTTKKKCGDFRPLFTRAPAGAPTARCTRVRQTGWRLCVCAYVCVRGDEHVKGSASVCALMSV